MLLNQDNSSFLHVNNEYGCWALICKLALDNWAVNINLCIKMGWKELRGNSDICIACSLVVPRERQTPFRVANFSDRPIKIHSDIPVAEYHFICSLNGSVIPIEVDPNSTSTSPSSSAIDRSVNKEGENWRTGAQLEGLSEDQKRQFLSLLKEYKDIFAVNNSDLGKSDLMEHEIHLGDCTPIK